MTYRSHVCTLLALIAGGAAVCAPAAAQTLPDKASEPLPTPAWLADYDEGVRRNVARVRGVTAEFRDIEAAHAAGYPTTVPGCLANPPQGGMGYHYAHPDRLDDQLDVEEPEILVYAPSDGDQPKLVGVEYIVPYTEWDRSEAPAIFGQDLKPSDALQLFYLHVWVWEENENGLFADWNPAVKCS